MGKAKQAIGIFLLVVITVVGNWYYYKQRQKPQPSPIKKEVSSKNKKGLQFRLSEGEAQLPKRVPVVDAKELATADVESILSRLEPIKTDPNDQTEFALRESSLPPPKTGQVINTKFPPDKNIKSNEVTSSGSLEVLRYSPKGEVPIAANLSITFSQPMVVLNSQSEAAQNVPVRLSPQVAGQWRWLGTKTLVFEPKVRFPMSTLYFIEVPAGTKSATGQSLQAAVNWQFKTPTLTLKRQFPEGGGIDTNPVIFLEFDQEINKTTILQSIRVKSDKGVVYKTRLATQEEIASSPTSNFTKSAKEKYWVALKVDNGLADKLIAPLPKNTTILVSVEAGASSVEGPLKTVAKQDFSFTTYRPLRVEDNTCNEQKYPCPPTRYVNVRFNNFLDPKSLDLTKAEFSPKVEGLTIQLYAYNMNIKGKFKGNRVYKLKLEPGFVKDNFGQSLETPTTLNFYMGASPKELTSLGGEFLVLDPFGPTKLPVFTTNHKELKVSLYAAQPTDWASFVQIRRKISEDYNYKKETYKEPVGRLISSEVVKLKSVDDEQIETAIDLSAAIQAGAGQVFVLIEPTEQPKEIWQRQYIRKWVQFTNIGLGATFDNEELLVWANSLKTGKPLAGVEINLRTISATTGADGIARIKLENASPSLKDVSCLIAKLGKDTAILPPSSYDPQAWTRSEQTNYLSWYVVDDRKTYRPGEKVTIKGWVRLFENKKGGDIKLAGEIKTVNYSLNDSQGNKISNGTAEVNPLGGFNLTLDLPATMNLGNANLSFEALPKTNYEGLQHSHNFQVQEFRRPEFEVSTSASENTNIIGGHSNVTVTASYYAGGTLNNADVNWEATATPTNYTPPNRSDYTFGKWTPWWISDGHHGFGRYYGGAEESNSTGESFQGKTSPNGTHNLRIDFDSVNPAQPTSLNVQASVMDVNRQAWSSSSTLLVHPANLYVGLRSEKTFVGKDEPFIIKSIVTDIDGKIIPNVNIDLRLARIEYDYDDFGRYKSKEVDSQAESIKSASDAVEVKFLPKEGGSYKLTAKITDEKGRPNETEMTLWVSGGKTLPERDLKQEQIQLIPDKKDYKVGETAQILVQAPFYPAEGLLTLRQLGIVKSERFTIDSPSYIIKVPIEEGYLPNVHLQVDLVGEAERAKPTDGNPDAMLPKRPAFAVGQLNLSIPPISRTLTVNAKPQKSAIEPGGETIIDLNLLDSANKPVQNGEVALFLVDEAILALSNYTMPNPIDLFYGQRGSSTSDQHLRSSIVLANSDEMALELAQDKVPAGGGGGEGELEGKASRDMEEFQKINREVNAGVVGGVIGSSDAAAPPPPPPPPAAEAPARSRVANGIEAKKEIRSEAVMPKKAPQPNDGKPIRVREDFNALAVFEAALSTDNNGHAQVKVKLPDSLTRYRVIAIAVAGEDKFGMGESSLTARMPLMVRPSAPRFLNFGDKFEFPIVLQNQTDTPLSVDVAMRATNATITGSAGRRLTVPANERVEVRLPVSAEMAGKARFQIGAVSGKWTDAAQVSLPVWTPATTEAFATYGTFEEDAIIQPVKAPADIYKQFGGLEVSTSSTQLQELTDAVLYIVSYPYECSEQVSSRVLTIAALKDVLGAFKAEGLPKAEELEARIAADMTKLKSLQNNDGGFDYWRKGEKSDPYVTVHVAHAMIRAKEKGYAVPEYNLSMAQNYLRNIESYLIPDYYSQQARDAITAYSLYVRKLMGDKDINKAKEIIYNRKLENLSLETIGWLWSVLATEPSAKQELEEIRQFVNNRATETAATAHFVTNYKDYAYLLLASDYRTDAILLDALLRDQPNNDLIPKLVRGLLDHRKAGRWESTQENVFVLLALDRYFATYEKVTPNFVARIWLGDKFAGEHEFKGRTTEKHQVNIPMKYLSDTEQNLILSKEGVGRIYYRAGMRYAPKSLDLAAAEYGFTVERKYEAVDNPTDVTLDKDGTWRIKAGARVRVKLSMVAQSRRYHVALVDPLPAGLEALNPALATTGKIPTANLSGEDAEMRMSGRYWWYGTWYQHQNFRDERIEAFTQLLWDGVYTYSYVARATTIGSFVVPPTKAEEMYHPETFGRSKTDKVVIYQ
ncbi:MAG: Ig-like domain-containing protein [Acidobacteria bacterium]|nr:Ig-like domain-containing protein [Acidobacteriota bacterium]